MELHVGDLLGGASKASSALHSFPLRRMEIVKCASKACCKLPGNEKHLGALGFISFIKAFNQYRFPCQIDSGKVRLPQNDIKFCNKKSVWHPID